MEKKYKSQLSNPFSTGGGGINFEWHVQSAFVLGLIIDGYSPVINMPIDKICFQAKRYGWNTDDLLVESNVKNRKLLCQIKHNISFRKSDSIFEKVINDAWNDFNNKKFNSNLDKIVLITGIIDKKSIDALCKINQFANTSDCAMSFLNKIKLGRFINDDVRNKFDILKHWLRNANGQKEIDDNELWKFCKVFSLLVVDLDFQCGLNETLLKTLIKCNSKKDASMVWASLVQTIGNFDQIAADVTKESLPEEILDLFEIRYENNIQDLKIKSDDVNEFLLNLILIGSWDETNIYDQKFITKVTGIKYEDFEIRCQNLLTHDIPFISVNNGIWKVRERKKLFKLCDKFLFPKDIKRYFGSVSEILRKTGRRFSGEKKITFKPLIGDFENSDNLRRSITQGLCIISNSDNLKNCSKSELSKIVNNFYNELFENINEKLIASWGDLLYIICEISPSVYLRYLENYIIYNSDGIKWLSPRKEIAWYSTNYISNLLWSLEVVSWHEKYLINAVRCLGELASIEIPKSNYSNTPINTLSSILMPWHPQTLANKEKQKNAVKLLVEEFPKVAWQLFKNILPHSDSTISYSTMRPKFMDIDIPKDTVVNREDLNNIYSHYFSLALSIAENSIMFSELIDCIGYLNADIIKLFLDCLSEKLDKWADKDKYLIWESLMRYKHNVVLLNERKDPQSELFKYLNKIIEMYTPQSVFYKSKLIFSLDYYVGNDEENEYDWEQHNKRKLSAIEEVYDETKLDGAIRFCDEVGLDSGAFNKLGVVIKKLDLIEIINRYSKNHIQANKFFEIVIGFISKNGTDSLLELELDKFSKEFIAEFLANIYYSDELKVIAQKLLGSSENLYWRKARVPYVYSAGLNINFSYLINKLIEVERYAVVVNMIGKSNSDIPISEDFICKMLKQAGTIQEAEHLDTYAVQKLIGRLQKSSTVDKSLLFEIEMIYLPWLNRYSKIQPKAIKTKISTDYKLFCNLIEKMYKKHNDDEHKHLSENESHRLFQLLYQFDIVPGVDWNGNFHEEEFKNWVSQAIQWGIENDREAVLKQTIGNGLAYAGWEEDALPNLEIIRVLDAKENEQIRVGFSIGIYNKRGVHWVDPEGKAEKALAEKYSKLADKIEKLGYSRFSNTLRKIADTYLEEAQQNIVEGSRIISEDEN